MSYQQPQYPQQPYPAQRPPLPPKKKPPVWVWIIVAVVGLCGIGIVGTALGGAKDAKDTAGADKTPAAATSVIAPVAGAAPASATAAAPAKDAAIPNVVGKNGAIASDELKRAGFKNVTHGSATPGVDLVIMLSNWTVVKVEPGAGAVVPTDSTVVLTLTKNNR